MHTGISTHYNETKLNKTKPKPKPKPYTAVVDMDTGISVYYNTATFYYTQVSETASENSAWAARILVC